MSKNLNFAQINEGKTKLYASLMSSDLLNDLTEAFEFYDNESKGYITQQQFKNILQNFGYHSMGFRDQNEELKQIDS